MTAQDATDTLDLALTASGSDETRIVQPRLLRDNGSSYVSAELADWLDIWAGYLGCLVGIDCIAFYLWLVPP